MAEQTKPDWATRYIARAELVQILSVNPSTITRWTQSGKIPKPVHIGGNVRWEGWTLWEELQQAA